MAVVRSGSWREADSKSSCLGTLCQRLQDQSKGVLGSGEITPCLGPVDEGPSIGSRGRRMNSAVNNAMALHYFCAIFFRPPSIGTRPKTLRKMTNKRLASMIP
jgi:hypothetical protein